MSLQQIESENLRRALLKLLATMPNQSSSDYILHAAISDLEGIIVSFDKFKAEQSWCHNQGLITLSGQAVETLTLTQRGLDVAEYRISFPGIARKRPAI